MDDNFYSIHKILLDRYIYQLTSKTFCTLLRFYKFYLSNREQGKDVSITYDDFQKEILVSDDHEKCESILGELDKWNLVKRFYKQNIYELNLTEINRYNIEEFNDDNNKEGIRERFRIHVKGKRKKILRKKKVGGFLRKYVEKISSRFSNKRISSKVYKLIEGHIKFLLKTKNGVELQDIRDLMAPFWDVSDQVIEKTCDIYNVKYHASKPAKYIHGILKNVNNEKETTKTKFKNLDKFKKDKEESDKKLAIKIATGDIDDNVSYKAFLELNDFDSLRKLYKFGKSILHETNSEDKLFDNYNWLEEANEKGK